MSMEAVVSFWQAVDRNPSLQRRIDPGGKGLPALASPHQLEFAGAVARAAGFDCSDDELRAAETVKRFWMRVDEDKQLQKEVLAADQLERADAVALIHRAAVAAGFPCTAEELTIVSRAQQQAAGVGDEDGQLSDSQLEAVAGGASPVATRYYYYYRGPISSSLAQNFAR